MIPLRSWVLFCWLHASYRPHLQEDCRPRSCNSYFLYQIRLSWPFVAINSTFALASYALDLYLYLLLVELNMLPLLMRESLLFVEPI